MRVVVATVQVPFVYGGAEVLSKTLCKAIQAAGHEAELVSVPFQGYPDDDILSEMIAFRLLKVAESMGQKSDRMIALKFPSYLLRHHHKVLWLLHQQRSAYDLWDTAHSEITRSPTGKETKYAIEAADFEAFREAKSIFTISKNVSSRLKGSLGFESKPLYPPPEDMEDYYTAEGKDYFFLPSRINNVKRQDLVIEALAKMKNKAKLVICGKPDHPSQLEALRNRAAEIGVLDRIDFLGFVSNQEKRRLYAESVGVVYTPFDEDYGYVAPEALAASKPLITTRDSGGPMEFVVNGQSGWVTEPDSVSLSHAMDEAWEDRSRSAQRGRNGREILHNMEVGWPTVLAQLLA